MDGHPLFESQETSNKETPMKVTASLFSRCILTSAQAAENPSQFFLKKAIQGNYAEVQMGSWRNRTVRATM
jgi:hypothetical protein